MRRSTELFADPALVPHTAAARTGRRRSPVWAVVLLAVVFYVVGQLVFSVARGSLSGGTSAIGTGVAFAVAVVLGYGIRILLVWAWVAGYEHRGLRTVGFPPQAGLARAGRGFVIGLVLFAVAVLLLAATGSVAPDAPRPGQQGLAALGGVLVLLVAWLVQGPSEEILYRGFLLQGLARRRTWVAALVSSVLFTAAHTSAWGSPLALLNLFLFALLACVYALREGGLWGVCGFHAGWNWVQGSVLGLSVSGADVPGGALLDLRTAGPDVLTGGTFGVEAGLGATLVLLVGFALTRFLRPAPSPVPGV